VVVQRLFRLVEKGDPAALRQRSRDVNSLRLGYIPGRRESPMVALQKRPTVPADVVSDSSVMDGVPVVRGTRIPAETILAYLRAGHSHRDVFEDYPSLPVDGIDAVIRWAAATYGPDWQQSPGPSH
jgi:uncharacterized protein (DUF433 family)